MIESGPHIFALYTPSFWLDHQDSEIFKEIHQEDLMHRLIKVLRVQLKDQFVFFDRMHHGVVQIVQISKKDIMVRVLNFKINTIPFQHVTFLLPLLKKEALEEAVYSLSEIGVETIQLVITKKSRQKLLHEKEFERLGNIVIAAAEQSKNYIYPDLIVPKKLNDVVIMLDMSKNKIVFDLLGESFFNLRGQVSNASQIFVLVGPEGGLTDEEMLCLKKALFQSCRLTSTTLRAVQATAIGAALFKLL